MYLDLKRDRGRVNNPSFSVSSRNQQLDLVKRIYKEYNDSNQFEKNSDFKLLRVL